MTIHSKYHLVPIIKLLLQSIPINNCNWFIALSCKLLKYIRLSTNAKRVIDSTTNIATFITGTDWDKLSSYFKKIFIVGYFYSKIEYIDFESVVFLLKCQNIHTQK